jgi:hypothetical protein
LVSKSRILTGTLLCRDRAFGPTQQKNAEILEQAFKEARDVILFFSINKSGKFQGYICECSCADSATIAFIVLMWIRHAWRDHLDQHPFPAGPRTYSGSLVDPSESVGSLLLISASTVCQFSSDVMGKKSTRSAEPPSAKQLTRLQPSENCTGQTTISCA